MASVNSIEDEAELQKMVCWLYLIIFFNEIWLFLIQFNAAKDPDERKIIRTRLLEVKKINSGMNLILFSVKLFPDE
jgi:hypothetical protein